MKDYQERVVEEKYELGIKVSKLSDFIGNENDATAEERVDLHVQLGLMCQYLEVLTTRIGRF